MYKEPIDAADVAAVYTLREAAELLGISYVQALRLAKAGRLPGAFRLGSRYRVSRQVLDALLGSGLATEESAQ